MRILQFYIGRTILSTIVLVLLLLTGLYIFVLFVNELDQIGQGTYTVSKAIVYVFMCLPQQIYQFFPMAGLVGALMGLGLLASNSELIVMRAAGVTLGQLTWAVMLTALVLVLVVTAVGESIAPDLYGKAQMYKTIATNGNQALITDQGIWIREKESFIHIQSAQSNHHLQGITTYNFDGNSRMLSMCYAEHADYHHRRWKMRDIVCNEINPKNNYVTVVHKKIQAWDVSFNPKMLAIADIDSDPANMNLVKLFIYIRYLKHNDLSAATYDLSFWQRVFQPLATAVMMFLAIPFIFGPLRTVPMGFRILSGIVVGFGFYIMNQFFGPISLVYRLPPFFAAGLPILLFAGAAYWLMRRAR